MWYTLSHKQVYQAGALIACDYEQVAAIRLYTLIHYYSVQLQLYLLPTLDTRLNLCYLSSKIQEVHSWRSWNF